ncbi:ATP-binding protein [Wukongibacter baidiensis]|uniref:sensor histidine kinase n=1 Tax=Wukongibacter baidiensis TaxID=1723361 RepID=UPI003D7F3BC8
MKWDIENKMLIPFMILVILPIIILGIVSYWNGYQLLLNNKTKNFEDNLDDHMVFINMVDKESNGDDLAKERVIDYFKELNKNGLVVFENNKLILNNLNRDSSFVERILSEAIRTKTNAYSDEDLLFVYRSFDKWKWTIGYGLNKDIFTDELIEIQKYTLLLAIIFLVFSMQATILISHNISKPMKILADMCYKIGKGNLNEKININREDEIGILAEAFNNMVRKLNKNTRKLLDMKKYNEDILRNISIGIITTDKKGKVLSINQAGENILEYSTNSSEEKEKVHNTLMKQLNETILKEESKEAVIVFNRAVDGNKQYLDITTSLLRTDNKETNGAICSFSDITKRKRIENNIERINRLTSVGELAAGLAHEIRNPLAGMKMSVQVLRGRLCNEDDESNLKLFNSTIYEIDRLNNLITELLDFAKPHSPKYEITNILEILNMSLDLTKKDMREKDIKTNVYIETSNLSVFVDKAQIEQVFINIIKNAVRASKQQGKLNIKLNIVSREKEKLLCISFEDNGEGIKQENLEKIFNPFFTTDPQGTGLGLSVVHKLVIENNGEIEAKSILGKGTKFEIKFPINGGDIDE